MAISHMGHAADMPCGYCCQKNLIRTCEDCCLMQISKPPQPCELFAGYDKGTLSLSRATIQDCKLLKFARTTSVLPVCSCTSYTGFQLPWSHGHLSRPFWPCGCEFFQVHISFAASCCIGNSP